MRLPFSPVELCVSESIFCFVHLKPLVGPTHRERTTHLLLSIFGQFRQIYPDYVTILSEVVSALERQFVLKYVCVRVCVCFVQFLDISTEIIFLSQTHSDFLLR